MDDLELAEKPAYDAVVHFAAVRQILLAPDGAATSSPTSIPGTCHQMMQRCLEVDGLGYQIFNVANDDMSVAATSQQVRDRFYDGVELRRLRAAALLA